MLSLEVDSKKAKFSLSQKDKTESEKQEDKKSEEPDEKAAAKVSEYVQLNYGKPYLSNLEQMRVRGRLCRGIHKNCTLLMTDGILHAPMVKNNQYRFTQLQFEKNRMYYYNNHWVVKEIYDSGGFAAKALVMRKEEEHCRSNSGYLVPSRLWKVKRSEDVKLFEKS